MTEKIRIVLADDHPIVLDGLRNLIRAEPDFELVGEAASGLSALKIIREQRPDVAVLDISMPELNGILLSRRLAGEMPALRLLVLTLHEDRAYLNQALEAGVRGYVLKRSAVENLVQAIRAVMVGGLYINPAIVGRVFERQTGQQAAGAPQRRGAGTDRPRGRRPEDGRAGLHQQGNRVAARRRRKIDRDLQGARPGKARAQDPRRIGPVRSGQGWLDF